MDYRFITENGKLYNKVMKNNDYAWNEFEKKSYLNGDIKIPSKYKIKINDDLEKRIELELILEKLPQYYLSYWAITNAKPELFTTVDLA